MPQKDKREAIVKDYYNTYKEDERFLKNHRKVEFLTNATYIEKFAKKGAKILELGAGTGAYSLYLAKKGYKVEAVEISEHNLEILNAASEEVKNLRVRSADAVDLGIYADDLFDVTLSLGPMYHIFNKKDIEKAIQEAIRVTKKDGIIIFSYLTNDAMFERYMVQKLWIIKNFVMLISILNHYKMKFSILLM